MRYVESQLSILAFAVLGVTGCGDSTAPNGLDPTSALHSLILGMQDPRLGYDPTTGTMLIDQSLDGIAPFVNAFPVNIGGVLQPMYALALHESFPPGTCYETVFEHSPFDTGCLPLALGLAVILWQSHSAVLPPDQLLVLIGDVSTSHFGDHFTATRDSAVALYATRDEYANWYSIEGTLTSNVTATTAVPCGIPLPAYAKSASCSIASFDEEGSVTFESNGSQGNCCVSQTITISRHSIPGLWMEISEVQPLY